MRVALGQRDAVVEAQQRRIVSGCVVLDEQHDVVEQCCELVGHVGERGLDELGEALLADLDHASILPDAVSAAPASPTMLNGFSGPHRLAAQDPALSRR